MDRELIRDTMIRLDKHMNSVAHIRLGMTEEELVPMVDLLSGSGLKRKRKVAILGSYMLLYKALLSHRQIDDYEQSDKLDRALLDGDYLFGSYIRWLIQYDEGELLAYLSSTHKRIQIQFTEGLPFKLATDQLFEQYRLYVGGYL